MLDRSCGFPASGVPSTPRRRGLASADGFSEQVLSPTAVGSWRCHALRVAVIAIRQRLSGVSTPGAYQILPKELADRPSGPSTA